jgi:two-component system, NarL family, response regulator LiaR
MKINVAIVEDVIEFSESIKKFLELSDSFANIYLFSSAEAFMEAYNPDKFDVVLMDIGLPGMNGINCISRMKPLNPQVQFITTTIYDDDENLFDALCAGATGYILKSDISDQIVSAINEVYSGGSPMSSSISRKVINHFSKVPKNLPQPILTKRETEVLDLLSKGNRYREISELLFISIDTVRTHIRNIYLKLEVSNKTQAINAYRK